MATIACAHGLSPASRAALRAHERAPSSRVYVNPFSERATDIIQRNMDIASTPNRHRRSERRHTSPVALVRGDLYKDVPSSGYTAGPSPEASSDLGIIEKIVPIVTFTSMLLEPSNGSARTINS